MAAKDVVDKARARGIKLSIAQVYTTRSAAKKKASAAGGTKRMSMKPARGPRRARVARGDDQLAFRRLVLSIGLPRAEAYLNELRRSVGL
jgi:hypothetical protein